MGKMMMGSRKVSLERRRRLNGQRLNKWNPCYLQFKITALSVSSQLITSLHLLTLEVKYDLVSFLDHKDTSLIHLALLSLLLLSLALRSTSPSYLSSTLCAHFKFLIHLSESKACIAAILFSLICLHSVDDSWKCRRINQGSVCLSVSAPTSQTIASPPSFNDRSL